MASVNEDVRIVNQRLDGLVQGTNSASGSFELDNGEWVIFTISVVNDAGAKILTTVDLTLYVDSVSADNALPGGDNIDESQWQIIGPWNDLRATDGVGQEIKVYIRNISAGTQTVLVNAQARVIPNTPTPESSA